MDIKEKINELRLRITEYDSGAEDHFFKMGILDILEILNSREARQNEISKNVNQALKNINERLLNHGKALQNFKEQLNNIEELEKKIFDPPGNPQEELKLCPFCGSTYIVIKEQRAGFWRHCSGCGTEGPIEKIKQLADSSWNRRSNPVCANCETLRDLENA